MSKRKNKKCLVREARKEEVKGMCEARTVVLRTMLGQREQGWALFNGKEMVEMTGNEIKSAILRGEVIHGLAVEGSQLVMDKKFFTRNIMEHRQVGNYKPMMEDENIMANIFYIILGKKENGLYDAISTKFGREELSEEKVKAYYAIGVISAGAKVENDKVILPDPVQKPVTENVESKDKVETPVEKSETTIPKVEDTKEPEPAAEKPVEVVKTEEKEEKKEEKPDLNGKESAKPEPVKNGFFGGKTR